MQTQEIIQFKLLPAMAECDLHLQRLHVAWQEALSFEALKPEALKALNEVEIRVLDQLVFRFGRLQDAIATRLLPALFQLSQEWRDNEPFIDKLNRAEKLGMLPSAEQWQLLRELRNQTTHEYPDQPALVLANLRRLVEGVPLLEQAYLQLKTAAKQRITSE